MESKFVRWLGVLHARKDDRIGFQRTADDRHVQRESHHAAHNSADVCSCRQCRQGRHEVAPQTDETASASIIKATRKTLIVHCNVN